MKRIVPIERLHYKGENFMRNKLITLFTLISIFSSSILYAVDVPSIDKILQNVSDRLTEANDLPKKELYIIDNPYMGVLTTNDGKIVVTFPLFIGSESIDELAFALGRVYAIQQDVNCDDKPFFKNEIEELSIVDDYTRQVHQINTWKKQAVCEDVIATEYMEKAGFDKTKALDSLKHQIEYDASENYTNPLFVLRVIVLSYYLESIDSEYK